MKTYKAKCGVCGTAFGFNQEDIKTKVELEDNRIEIHAYIPCEKCGLKLTVARTETTLVRLEKYTQ